MDVILPAVKLRSGRHEVICVAPLPNFVNRMQTIREASANVFHGFGEIIRCEEQMNVVGHDCERVEFVKALFAVVLQRLQKQIRVGFFLENAAAIRGNGGYEKRSGRGSAQRFGHTTKITRGRAGD